MEIYDVPSCISAPLLEFEVFWGSTTFPLCFSRVMGSPETLAKTLPFLSYARMIRILLLRSWRTVGDQLVLKELHFAFH